MPSDRCPTCGGTGAYGYIKLPLGAPDDGREVEDEMNCDDPWHDQREGWSQPIGYEGTATLDAFDQPRVAVQHIGPADVADQLSHAVGACVREHGESDAILHLAHVASVAELLLRRRGNLDETPASS